MFVKKLFLEDWKPKKLERGLSGSEIRRKSTALGEVLSLLDNETGMHSCLESKPRSPGDTGGKRRHPRAYENTGIGADEPEAR
jgi:hypothetical protein